MVTQTVQERLTKYKDFGRPDLIEIAARVFDTSTPDIMLSYHYSLGRTPFQNHIDRMFERLVFDNDVDYSLVVYAVDLLEGKKPFILNDHEAILAA